MAAHPRAMLRSDLEGYQPLPGQCLAEDLERQYRDQVRPAPLSDSSYSPSPSRPPIFIFAWLQHPSVSQTLLQCAMPFEADAADRVLYQSCLHNAMLIISSLIDYQVDHVPTNLNTTSNPFASKMLIKVCLDFLLQQSNDIKASICLRCLTSLAKVGRTTFSIVLCIRTSLDHAWSCHPARNEHRTIPRVHHTAYSRSSSEQRRSSSMIDNNRVF